MPDKGKTIMYTYGEYSDRGWAGPFKILKSYDEEETQRKFVEENTDESGDRDYYLGDYPSFLVKEGYIEIIDNDYETHLGSYYFRWDKESCL